jgi:hypothetical protein
LEDLGIISQVPKARLEYQLTETGLNLVSALKNENFLISEDATHLCPGFEAIYDVFSATPTRYGEIFDPPVSIAMLERVIGRALLPGVECPPWEPRQKELERLLPDVAQGVADTNGATRIDTVRLALFTYLIGRGQPAILDNQAVSHEGEWQPNGNAISSIAIADPKLYMVGTVRTSRRHWSLILLKRTASSG